MVSINKSLFALVLISLSFFSCEDVIDVKLNNSEPRIVIEAKLYDQFQPATVIITKTSDFFDTLTFNTVSNAEVIISDNEGNSAVIPESDSAGIYQASFFGKIGKTYTLTVNTEGQSYTANAEMCPPLEIDSMIVKYRTDPLPYQDSGYDASCIIKDSANFNQYAKLEIYKNRKLSKEMYLFDDTYTDGNDFEYPFYNETFQANDTVSVIVSSCDPGVYEYLYTFSEITGSFQNTSTPYNPTSNITNGALGYFGVFSLSGAFLIVEE